ncbi:hypothetical protein SUDANB15_07672 (plasmid) [Streptomyces sp. enrichment culture]|uniref:hypothetical protein n=1 Tax=Streptomyces sp. enrichment culture TaxID=1795815 RepID=UPI003F56DEA2
MSSPVVTPRPAADVAARIRFSGLYAQAERFYTRQLGLTRAADTAGLAATFAPGTAPAGPEPIPGARYWIGKLEIVPENEHTLRTRCSVFSRPADASGPGGLRVTVVEDVLTRFDDDWLVTDRRVLHDTAL